MVSTVGTEISEQDAHTGGASTEEQLRLSEARLNEAQRIAKIGSWERDLSKDQGWWSEESYRLFGITPKDLEITREQVIERIHPDDRPRIREAWKGALERGEPYKLDFRIVLPDGQPVAFYGDRVAETVAGLEEAGVERIYVQWLDLDDLDGMKETVEIVRGG